ncbi:MAG TPA: hypothetical protein VHN77_02545 [Phycisphaerales bacterium]|nr:hypothetical protein [Phycisphaerales bacterium]
MGIIQPTPHSISPRPADMLPRAVMVAGPGAHEVDVGGSGLPATPIDALMDKASVALVKADYFTTEELCLRAIERCRRMRDWERVARAVLPLQEARRQIRQFATDGPVRMVQKLPSRGEPLEVGCYLAQPPMIGLDARTFRELARGRRVPVMAIAKEPTTAAGKWPVVGVGGNLGAQPVPVVVRVQVEPPTGGVPDVAWMLATQEALGDAAIAKVEAGRKLGWPADHRVEDLIEYLEAVPDHEKLHQALEATAREAAGASASTKPRRRGMLDDPRSF